MRAFVPSFVVPSFSDTIQKLEIALDAQLTGWSAYKELNIEFPSIPQFNQKLEKNYHNSWAIRLGAQYGLTERFDIRAGINFDMTPVDKDYYNPETPGMNKIAPSIGLSFKPFEGFSIDVVCSYVAGLGEDNAAYTYANMLTGGTEVFRAKYKVNAWTPSIGLGYKF